MKNGSVPSNLTYKMFDGLKADGDSGNIKGYASAFDVVDEVDEVVVRNAFAKSLGERGDTRLILSQHDPFRNPIGKARVFEDEKGLGFEGTIVTSTSEGHDVYELIKAGVLSKVSIGYNVEEDSWKDGVRYLKQIDLREISIVTFPANEATEVVAVKSVDTIRKLASLKETVLDEDILKELTDDEILNAEVVLKRIKKERGMDDEDEKTDEEEKTEDDDDEKEIEDENDEKLTEEELEEAEDILSILREEDSDEDDDEEKTDDEDEEKADDEDEDEKYNDEDEDED